MITLTQRLNKIDKYVDQLGAEVDSLRRALQDIALDDNATERSRQIAREALFPNK